MSKYQIYPDIPDTSTQPVTAEDLTQINQVIKPLVEDGASLHDLVDKISTTTGLRHISAAQISSEARKIEGLGQDTLTTAEAILKNTEIPVAEVEAKLTLDCEYLAQPKMIDHFRTLLKVQHIENLAHLSRDEEIDDTKEPQYVEVEVCSVSGLLPGPYCLNKVTQKFMETTAYYTGNVPTIVCTVCKEMINVKVCSVTNLLPNAFCTQVWVKFVKGEEPVDTCTECVETVPKEI